jgi:hypothetical protein
MPPEILSSIRRRRENKSRSNTFILVFDRACMSTFFTITAQCSLIPTFDGIDLATTT